MPGQWNHKIIQLQEKDFEATTLEIFRLQYGQNQVYRNYAEALHIKPSQVNKIAQIPFLPIRFFKTHRVQTTEFTPQAIFESSGTTGSVNSWHLIKDIVLYEESLQKGFELFYGPVKDYCILGLLPSYLERKNSSLVYMVNKLIQLSGHPENGFFLDEFEKLTSVLKELENKKQKTLLIGVTFALLDFAERFSSGKYPDSLQHTIIMETGGMKGRRKEMIRQEVHAILKKTFSLTTIHAEYGMTELLSQAYSHGNGVFRCPPWMKVMIRDEEDPFELYATDSKNTESISGAINIIDLANVHSCSFIATDDAGKIYKDGSFEVLGRLDNSDLRGCSLMAV